MSDEWNSPSENQVMDWNIHNDHADNAETMEISEMNGKPTLTILGRFRGGVLVRAEWTGEQHQLSDRTLAGMEALGMVIIDDPADYVFKGTVL